MDVHHLEVVKTARYYTLGEPTSAIREVWFVCHGYGQLARFFLRHFECLKSPTRFLVAPEALSRFYLNTDRRIGATWMTSEDRENEMKDYIAYLDRLSEKIFSALPVRQYRVVVLGFSQGVATVCRWVSRGRIKPDRVICWAGQVPPEIDLGKTDEPLRNTDLHFVLGTKDEYADTEFIKAFKAQMAAYGVMYNSHSFEGGHVIERTTLEKLAAIPFAK